MPAQFLNPPGLCKTHGWTHAVATTGGRTIHISGQVGMDGQGAVPKGDLRRQTELAFENIQLALAAAGAKFDHVVNTRLYVVNLRPEHVPVIREVRSRYINAQHPPASTLVGVLALVGADWLIEIEATAHLED